MSQLQAIKDEILRRFQRPPTTNDVPGYAGGTLGEQLDRDAGYGWGNRSLASQQTRPRTVTSNPQSDQQDATYQDGSWQGVQADRPRSVFSPPPQQPQPVSQVVTPPQQEPQPVTTTGQVLTPANQANITRPRSVFAPPQQAEDSNAPFGSNGQPFSPTRDRRTQPQDNIATDAQRLRDLETKKPKWTDRAVDALRGVNQALGSNPSVFTPTKGEREELKARGMLGQDIEIQKAQTAQEMAQMVPIYDTAGNIVGTAPRRTAVGTQIRATDTGTRAGQAADRLTETKRRNDAYISHVDDLPAEKQSEAARKIWMSGVADGNDELKADLGKRMGLKEALPDSDKGTVQTDANGNFTIVHPRAATSQTVTDTTTGKPTQSWVITKEQRQDDRARRSQAAAMQRTLVMAQATGARLGNPEDLDSIANEAQANADAATAKAQALQSSTKPSDKKLAGEYLSEAGRHQAQAARAREAATKARSGQNFAAPQTQVPKKYNSLNEAIQGFKNSPKNTTHRDPTPDEINRLKTTYGVQ